MCSKSISLEENDQESALIPEGTPPTLHPGPSTQQEGMYFLHYADQDTLSTPGGGNVSGAVMLAPTRSPSFTPGSSDLYYSPPPAPLPYTSPEMLPPVVSLSPSSPSVENHYPGDEKKERKRERERKRSKERATTFRALRTALGAYGKNKKTQLELLRAAVQFIHDMKEKLARLQLRRNEPSDGMYPVAIEPSPTVQANLVRICARRCYVTLYTV